MGKIIERQKCKEIQLRILGEIDRICSQNNLHYYIAYGTLLGAVRHKGYIPWDDDIDICMLYDDYIKLLSVIKKGECDWLSIVDKDTPDAYMQFAKAVDNRTIAKQEDSNHMRFGIWVDILPLNKIPQNRICQKIFRTKCHLLRNIMIAVTTDFNSKESKIDKKRLAKKILNIFGRCLGKDRIFRYYLKYTIKYEKSNTGVYCCLGTPYIQRELLTLSDILNTRGFEFEGNMFKGLANYDMYLKMLYGDYMKLPPEDKRRTHHITAYWI